MTLPTRQRPFRASSKHYEKNLRGSEATRVVPAQLTHANGQDHDAGVAIFQGHFFMGILTLADARRVADSLHDIADGLEGQAA